MGNYFGAKPESTNYENIRKNIPVVAAHTMYPGNSFHKYVCAGCL
jgi:hypothetical protein